MVIYRKLIITSLPVLLGPSTFEPRHGYHLRSPLLPSPTAPTIPPQLLELSPLQLRWLVARMDTGTDVAASRVIADLGAGAVSKGTLRHWKRNATFHKMLDLVRAHKDEAFRALVSGSMATLAFEALRGLLTGSTPYEKVQGLRAYMDITKSTGAEGTNIDGLMDMLRAPRTVVLQVHTRDSVEAMQRLGSPQSTVLGLQSGDSAFETVEGEYEEVQ